MPLFSNLTGHINLKAAYKRPLPKKEKYGRTHVLKIILKNEQRKIIENRVKKKNLEQIFPKFYNFPFRTLICIINYA